jgi:ERF superfamily protein
VSEPIALHRKLAEVYTEVEKIDKKGKAPAEMGGFRFVQVGDAADPIRKALAARKLTMLPTSIDVVGQTEHEDSKQRTVTTIDVRVTWTLTDGETGESTTIQSMGTGADRGDKYLPKALTGAMKYALLLGFLMPTGDDAEQADTSDRRRTGVAPPAARDATHVGPRGLSKSFTGMAIKWNMQGLDGQVRMDPEDVPHYGFVLECDDDKKRHVRTEGDLALLMVQANPIGQAVTVAGTYRVEDLPKKGGGTYKAGVIYAQSVTAPDGTPLGTPLAAPKDPAEAELDAALA